LGEDGDIGRHFRFELGILARQRRQLGQILRARAVALPLLEACADVPEALEDLLRALPVLPEVRLGSSGL